MVKMFHAHGIAILFALHGLISPDPALAAPESGEGLAWCAEDRYAPPDYEGFFPDSADGAEALAALWASPDRDEIETAPLLASVRQGLRRYDGDRAELLRWLGRRFVDGQTSQDGVAVEILYHALDFDSEQRGGAEVRSAALRFGVSVVRPMPSNLLRALAAFSIASEDGDDLSRIVWAITDQRDEALAVLEDYAKYAETVDHEKVALVRKFWTREIKAHDWVRDRKVAAAREEFEDALPGMLTQLASGSSEGRRQTLELVLRNDLLGILPESSLASFAQCASDAAPGVRALVARLVGERWILAATYTHPRAVDLLLALSRDEVELVRHNAVHYGLSAVSPKDEEIITRLLEVAATHPESPLYDRINWGLRSCQPQVRTLLDMWRLSGEPEKMFMRQRLLKDIPE